MLPLLVTFVLYCTQRDGDLGLMMIPQILDRVDILTTRCTLDTGCVVKQLDPITVSQVSEPTEWT